MGPWATTGRRRRTIGLLIAPVVVAGGLMAASAGDGPLRPGPGVAIVDGSDAEWTAADDVGALAGNDPPHLERGRLSLRYDCEERVLFALLRAGEGLRLRATDADETYLRFGSAAKLVQGSDGIDGEVPDAAWVDRVGGTAGGIEMSAPLAPGVHEGLRVHAKLSDDSEDGYETLDLSPRYRQLVLACPADPGGDGTGATGVGTGPGSAPPFDPVDPAGLARTGAPFLPLLVAVGVVLCAAGAALRRGGRWHRRARR